MNTKLTLKLDQFTIEKAKKYAHDHGVSLSRMIESYFREIVEEKPKGFRPTPLVSELSGILSEKELAGWKSGYAEHLAKKYSR